ncbi:hypothetical protein SFRURICE_018025, partial [Spodoptera frugiperda]
MDELLAYQKEVLDNLKKSEKNFKKTPKDRIKKSYLETRLDNLEQLWITFKDGHKSLIGKVTLKDKEDTYFTEDMYEEFEELYVSYKTLLKEALQPYPTSSILKCRNLASCKRCGRRHHSLLHFEKDVSSESKSEDVLVQSYATPSKIDILLGAEVYSEILLDGIIRHNKILAQNTTLGWVLSGRVSKNSTSANNGIITMHLHLSGEELLRKFWEMENEPNLIQKKMTDIEQRCEEFYDRTTTRDKEGRFIVKLPFDKEDPEC